MAKCSCILQIVFQLSIAQEHSISRDEFDYLYDFRCAEESRCLDNRNEEILSGYRFRRSISDTLLGTLVEAAQRDHSYIT